MDLHPTAFPIYPRVGPDVQGSEWEVQVYIYQGLGDGANTNSDSVSHIFWGVGVGEYLFLYWGIGEKWCPGRSCVIAVRMQLHVEGCGMEVDKHF